MLNLTLGNERRQIRLTVPIATASVRAVRADRYQYSERIALAVLVCVAPQGSNAFAFYVYRKSELRQKVDSARGDMHLHEGRAAFWCTT